MARASHFGVYPRGRLGVGLSRAPSVGGLEGCGVLEGEHEVDLFEDGFGFGIELGNSCQGSEERRSLQTWL